MSRDEQNTRVEFSICGNNKAVARLVAADGRCGSKPYRWEIS